MSHFILCAEEVQTEGQLSCIPTVKVLLKLFGDTGLSQYIYAKVHEIKLTNSILLCKGAWNKTL